MTSDDNPSLWHDKEACESVGDIKYKPWGYYVDIHRADDVVFKQIVVHPGEELSYQSHEKRNEFWFIKTGVGVFTYRDVDINTSKGDSFTVFAGNKHMIKKGAILIDVGISRVDDESEKGYRVVGDIDFNSVNGVAQAVTPVPGGVGPMTITMLLINTIKSALDSINE